MANPLLEAFGNSKTIRNDNSSRFGKWIEVYFSPNGRIIGAQIINYLLEKSRVIYQDAGERNYHIFYLLCHQARHFPTLGLQDGPWNYLKEAHLSANELEKFNEMMTAMDNFSISQAKALSIFELVAAVLHIGNFEIIDEGDSCRIKGSPTLDKVCELLHISADLLNQTLCSRLLDTSKDRIYKSLSYAECCESAANLAKLLYSKLFDWLVSMINGQLYDSSADTASTQQSRLTSQSSSETIAYHALNSQLIGVLDIFGFEIFKHNSFEQFCINYANEKLQQHFNFCTFKHEEEVYTSEAIDFEHIEFKDNVPILELVEKPGSCIMMFLNDEIMLPRGSDESLIKKLHSNFTSHTAYGTDIREPSHFLLHHYAGDVTYEIKGFLLKNTDRVSEDLVGLITSSSNSLVNELFADLRASKKPLASQFKVQLDQMMARIGQTNSHFVRCIKANSQKVKDRFDAPLVLEQLKYSGVFEAVGIRQKGFPFRLSLTDFTHRYKGFDLKFHSLDLKEYCRHLISLLGEHDGFRVGNSMVFYRFKEHRLLELKRNVYINGLVIVAQKCFKRHMAINLKHALAEAKPHFEAAIRSQDIPTLEETIARYDHLTFEMKVIKDAKELRHKLIERKQIEVQISQLNIGNPESCYDDLENMLKRAEAIDYSSRIVEEAKDKFELAKNIRLVRQQFSKIKNSHVPLDEIEETVCKAQGLGMEDDVRST
jgi:myosin heavy subunit